MSNYIQVSIDQGVHILNIFVHTGAYSLSLVPLKERKVKDKEEE